MLNQQIRNNLNNMHILRGVAAMYVVIYHAKFILWCGGSYYVEQVPMSSWSILDKLFFALDMFSSAGREMVFIFFLLSGFFISFSLQYSKYSYIQFLKIRILRIYMPFVGSLFLAFLFFFLALQINPEIFIENSVLQLNAELFESLQNFNIQSFSKSFFMTREGKSFFGFNNVYWSLAYEMLFYFIIGLLISKKKRLTFGLVSILIYLFIRITGIQITFGRVIFDYFIFFGIGILIHLFIEKYENKLLRIKINKYIIDGISLASFGGIVLSLKLNFSEIITELITVLFSIAMIYRLLIFDLKSNLITKTLNFLGNISYSLYLCHIPFLLFVYALISSYLGEVIWIERSYYWIFSLISIFICLPLYYFVEKPSIKLNQKLKMAFKSKIK